MSVSDPPPEPRLDLLKLDYEQTSEFIQGVLSVSNSLRGWAITLSLGLVGFGFDRHSVGLCVIAVAVSVTFAALDGYHGWLYSEAVHHLNGLERIWRLYYTSLGPTGGDPLAARQLKVAFGSHVFGFLSRIPPFSLGRLRAARPAVVFLLLYPSLILIALIAASSLSTGIMKTVAIVPCVPVGLVLLYGLACGGAPTTRIKAMAAVGVQIAALLALIVSPVILWLTADQLLDYVNDGWTWAEDTASSIWAALEANGGTHGFQIAVGCAVVVAVLIRKRIALVGKGLAAVFSGRGA
jgi:hypothetical protein